MTPITVARAVSVASMEYCMAQTADKVPDQLNGCILDITTGVTTCGSGH